MMSKAFACLIACTIVSGCAENAEQSLTGGAAGPAPIPSSVAALLVAHAPAIGKTSFGAGVDVSDVRTPWLFSEARIVDETLYVTYYTKQSDRQTIAVLSHGVPHPIWLGQDSWAISFKNDNRVITVGNSGVISGWYLIQGDRATAIPRPASPVYGIPHHVLADGDSCADGLAGSGSALDELRDHRRVSIVTTAAMARATHGALDRAIGVYCDHFRGKNYATMDVPGVIFRLDGSNAAIVSTGWIEASSDRHLLIETFEKFIEAEVR